MSSESAVPVRQQNIRSALHGILPHLNSPIALLDPGGEIRAASAAFWRSLELDSEAASHLADLSEAKLSDLPAEHQPQAITLKGPAGGGKAARLIPLAVGGGGYLLQIEDGPASTQPLIEALPRGLFLVNADGAISAFNQALAGLVSAQRQQFLGEPYEAFFEHLAGRANEPDVVRGSLRQAVVAVEERPQVELAAGGDARQHLEITLFPLWSARDESAGWGGLVQDITAARDQLAWKLELLSMLAHDLRTPLATLKGHATALLANHQRWSDSMVAEFLEAMDHGTDELVRQVDRSLALTRVEAGRLGLRPEAAQPSDLIGGALERAASSLDEMKVDSGLPEGLPAVRVDPARIEEVLVNLLDNAARYNPAQEPLRVGAYQQESMLTFYVEDAGPGVATSEQETIFEKHGGGSSGADGDGLGLFISRTLVEAHGGRIWVDSPAPAREGGARFSFTVPVMPDQPLPERAGEARSGPELEPEHASSILVVEHESDLQSLLRSILDAAGYHVTLVGDGPSAIDHLSGHNPDLVVLDLNLPRMDGLTVCRTMRRWSYVPILVLTSKTAAQDLVEAVDAGADDYLTKPFQSAELLARLRALLRRRERWGRSESQPGPLRINGLVIDEASREVRRNGNPLELTPTEFELLAHLARHRGQVLTHQQLIGHLWPQGQGNRHALFVHVNRLRHKLEPDPDQPHYIITRWGVGYTLLPRRSN